MSKRPSWRIAFLAAALAGPGTAAAQTSVPTFDANDYARCFTVLSAYAPSLVEVMNDPAATVATIRKFHASTQQAVAELERVIGNIKGDIELADVTRTTTYERTYLAQAVRHLVVLEERLATATAQLKCWSIMLYLARQRLPPYEPAPFVKLPVPPPPPRRPPTRAETAAGVDLEVLQRRTQLALTLIAIMIVELQRTLRGHRDELERRDGDTEGPTFYVRGFGGPSVPVTRPDLGGAQELDLKTGFNTGLEVGAQWKIGGNFRLRGGLEGGYLRSGLGELVNKGGGSARISGHYGSLYAMICAELGYALAGNLELFAGAGIGAARNHLSLRSAGGAGVFDDWRTELVYKVQAGAAVRIVETSNIWGEFSVGYIGTTGSTVTTNTGVPLQVGGPQEVVFRLGARIPFR